VPSLVESVPNVSEGRRRPLLESYAACLRGAPGVRLLDWSADSSHHRSVFTIAGGADAVGDAVLALVGEAIRTIDLRAHRGAHPRIGAVDVIPFVPLGGTTMETCVGLARRVGRTIAERFAVPVFLYEEAATDPDRRRLEDIRRGQFEGLAEKLNRPEWRPDFGPAAPHPSAGAIVVGARPFLVAYNLNHASDRLDVAKAIASEISERDGGLPAVKALGLELSDRGLVQVSMNLTDVSRTSMGVVFDRIVDAAARRGVRVLESELIGLVPEAALAGTTAEHLQLRDFTPARIIERLVPPTGKT
jgi:glutamate formiminotransferase